LTAIPRIPKENLVVQHDRLIEARCKLSVGEQRLIKTLMSMIDRNDNDFKPCQISVSAMAGMLELSRNDLYRKINGISKKLASNTLTFQDVNGSELQSTWLSSAVYLYKRGAVELEFSPKLKPFLLHLKSHFTAYELGNIIHLKKMYSIRIYELLKQYQAIGRRRFTLDKLRETLMLDGGQYKTYNNFKKWILIPSQKELQEKTDISFTWKEERQCRFVVAIEFIITPQKRLNGEAASEALAVEPDARDGAWEENPIASVLAVPDIPHGEEISVISTLTALGVARKAAEALAREHSPERIAEAVAYAQAQRQAGKVKNLAGFVVEAVKREYRDGQAEERKRQAEEQDRKRRAKAAEEAGEKQARKAKLEAEARKNQAITEYLASLTREQFEALVAEFVEVSKGNKLLLKKYREEGLESPLVKGCFGVFVSARLPHADQG
jgi:plasmid replication initiation protein